MNNVFNDTDTKEVQFTVNARDGANTLTIKGIKCVADCAPPAPEEKELDEA